MNTATTNEQNFKIRAYGRTELAQMYSPHLSPNAAWRKLKQWIDLYPGLALHLCEMGCSKNMRTWPPSAVRLIVEALGEP